MKNRSRHCRNIATVLVWLSLMLLVPGRARAQTNPPAAVATLRVLNRDVITFRTNLGTYAPEQRAAAAEARIERALAKPASRRVEAQLVDGKTELRVHGQTVFFILPGDVDELGGETAETVVEDTLKRLDRAIAELEEMRDQRGRLRAVALGTTTTAGLVIFVWLLARNRRWLETRLIKVTADQAGKIKSHSLRVFGLQNTAGLWRGLLTAFFWTATSIGVFFWLEFVLQLFPQTRPFGEQLQAKFLQALGTLGQSTLHALPNLGIVLLVLALARFASGAARRFFTVVARENSRSRFFDPTTAPIAQRLTGIFIWITAIIVAFPYIPGSQTPAFRGISVLAGLMLSLGSGNLIAQLVGGLTMVYNRSCRPGDYVRLGEYEGTITAVGFFSARLVTTRNEEIVLPNSTISGGTLINYSRLNESPGVLVPTTVTIGYDTPWRQVHALLLQAARRTTGLKPEPAPAVQQRALSDFYVEYELRVTLEKPATRGSCLSQLHGHIQDVFNEHGVQIMSPHFEANPPQPVLVAKEKWFAPPAKREA